MVCACGAPGPVPGRVVVAPAQVKRGVAEEPVDPIARLGEPARWVSFVVPGAAQLEVGGQALQAPDGSDPIQVQIFEEQGSELRVGVVLDHVRFAVWTPRARLLGIVVRDVTVSSRPGGEYVDRSQAEPIAATLHAHALVRRLGHKGGWTQVRYLGAVEVDGWVPDDVLVDREESHGAPIGRIPTGRPTQMVTPGAVIRAEPRWPGRELAVMANGYFVDKIRDADAPWLEVAYADGDVTVRGFLSTQDPPGRVHRPREPEVPPLAVVPSATVAAGTCLYGAEGGEPIGFVVGDRPAAVEPGRRVGWFTVGFDTPWGPTAFAARGPTETELVACAPAP